MVAIISLKLVAYGNTKQNADGSFTCQHGQKECDTDVLHLCTQYKISGEIKSISTEDTSILAWVRTLLFFIFFDIRNRRNNSFVFQ